MTLAFRLLFFISLIAITILAFLPDYDGLPPVVELSDLLNHTVAFTVLMILSQRSYPKLHTKTVVIALLLYALFIEIVQYFLPTRCADWRDVVADGVGIFLALIILGIYNKITTK